MKLLILLLTILLVHSKFKFTGIENNRYLTTLDFQLDGLYKSNENSPINYRLMSLSLIIDVDKIHNAYHIDFNIEARNKRGSKEFTVDSIPAHKSLLVSYPDQKNPESASEGIDKVLALVEFLKGKFAHAPEVIVRYPNYIHGALENGFLQIEQGRITFHPHIKKSSKRVISVNLIEFHVIKEVNIVRKFDEKTFAFIIIVYCFLFRILSTFMINML
jgi:hypothetical protein